MPRPPLLLTDDCGLYCPRGDFHIDPWRPVPRAVITHAHSDHARGGSRHYLTAAAGEHVLRARLGSDLSLRTLPWGEPLRVHDVTVSFHPAGHILGSAQVCVEADGERWVVSGDYKAEADPTCDAWAPVRCHTYVTESTFGLPIYRWQPQTEIWAELNTWWAACQAEGATAIVFAYALGKAQRILAGLDASLGPIGVHGALLGPTAAYRASGIALPDVVHWRSLPKDGPKPLIIAPPGNDGSPWLRQFGPVRTAFASGWMAVRGARRRRGVDRGFVLSDHVDWPSLLACLSATGAEQVLVTHGYVQPVVRYLNEMGLAGRAIHAAALRTEYEGEQDTGSNEPGADPTETPDASEAPNASEASPAAGEPPSPGTLPFA